MLPSFSQLTGGSLRATLVIMPAALALLVCGGIADAQTGPAAAGLPPASGLGDYLAWARGHSPRLAEQAAKAEALRENARKAGALPALRLAWGEMIVPVETRVGPQQRVFSVSQSLPWFGTLSAREHGMAAEAAAAGATLRSLGWQVEQDVRSAWYELAYLQAQAAIVGENLDLARQSEAHVRARYEAGEGTFGAMLSAQMEIGKLAARLEGLLDRRQPATIRLNVAAGLPADHPAPLNVVLPDDLLDVQLPAEPELRAVLWRNSSALAAMRHQVDGRRHGVQVASRRAYPELTLGVDYIMTDEARMAGVADSGKDPVIARFGVSLPLWGGEVAAEQKASAGLLRAASAGASDLQLRLTARLSDILFAWREAGRNLDLYAVTLLPRSVQNLSVITAAYEAGQVMFDQLLAARQAHLGLELARLRAATDRALALSDLAVLLGMPLPDLIQGNYPADSPEPESE